MKILSLILRIVTLLVIVALGVVWFLNKDEIAAINDAYKSAATELNVPDQPLSKVITKGMNDLKQTQSELRESKADVATLERDLTDAKGKLTTAEDQLRSTNQKLRNTQRDLEDTKEEMASAKQVSERLTEELKTVRNDLIRVNKEKFELSQKVESTEEEKRALARRVQQLEEMSSTGSVADSDSEGGDSAQADSAEEIARLRSQLEAARKEITRLSNNPIGAALATANGGDESLPPNWVRVKSINLDRGMVVLTPSASDEFVGVTTLSVDRDGSPIAELRLRQVYPDYLVAEILPSSAFAEALQSGSAYSYRR